MICKAIRALGAACSVILLVLFLTEGTSAAQGLTVLPVTLRLQPGQLSGTLTVVNQGLTATSFQLRAYAWDQSNGSDTLTATDALLASPPLATLSPGANQVVRMILRRPADGREGSFRILLDQIPPPATAGIIRIALRFSIPIFVEPTSNAAPHIDWRIERIQGHDELVAVNSGNQHQTVHDVTLAMADGKILHAEVDKSPYVLAGATRRWKISGSEPGPGPGAAIRLKGQSDAGQIDQQVVVAGS